MKIRSVKVKFWLVLFLFGAFLSAFNFVPQLAKASAPVLGLSAYWNFNEGSGTAAADTSGNGKNAILINGPLWATGKIGQALSFDGVNDYVNAGIFSGTTEFSVSYWCKVASAAGDQCLISKYFNNGSALSDWIVSVNTNKKVSFASWAGGYEETLSASTLTPGTWAHILVTFDTANTKKVYVNGNLESSAVKSGNINSGTQPMVIGAYNINSGGTAAAGQIDEVRVYSRALSATEVAAVFADTGSSGVSTDTIAPTIPGSLLASAVSSSQINLSWTASTDATGVAGYKIFRDGAQIATSVTNSFADSGLAASTNYSYTVSAFDDAGNNSAQSSSAGATTQAGGAVLGSNIYLSQNGGGSGASCGSALAIAFFNTASNWAATATSGKISPGTTVHLCGTLTTKLVFQGSGASGSPIILKFEDGAKMSAPTWTGTAISGASKSYIEIDGGTNGILENTNNGSSPTYANHNDDGGIYLPNCSNCRVHGLSVSNMYVKNTSDSQGGGDAIDLGGSSNSRVDHNIVHDAQFCVNWTLNANLSNIEIDHNTFYHCNWGTAMGASSDVNVSSILWHDNEVYDWQNWDDASQNQFHHNGLHVFLEGGSGASVISGLKVYNNYFHGNPGEHMTANIYLEANSGTISLPQIFNNVHLMSANNPSNGDMNLKGNVTSPSIYNSIFSYATNTGGLCVMIQGATNVAAKNNIFLNCGQAYYNAAGSFLNTDYNDYFGNTSFGPGVGDNTTLALYKTSTGFEAHGVAASPALNSSFVPGTGSPVIGAGVNLNTLGIAALNADKSGLQRPVSAAWDIGVYQVSGGGSATPLPGDFNLDHIINSLDYSLMNSHWYQSSNIAAYDLVTDGLINSLDFAILKNNWGKTW